MKTPSSSVSVNTIICHPAMFSVRPSQKKMTNKQNIEKACSVIYYYCDRLCLFDTRQCAAWELQRLLLITRIIHKHFPSNNEARKSSTYVVSFSLEATHALLYTWHALFNICCHCCTPGMHYLIFVVSCEHSEWLFRNDGLKLVGRRSVGPGSNCYVPGIKLLSFISYVSSTTRG